MILGAYGKENIIDLAMKQQYGNVSIADYSASLCHCLNQVCVLPLSEYST